MKKLLIICGPTATGKTALAIALAKRFNGELISADSRHVYKGLDILTGKDLPADGTKIWATDVVSLTHPYSISQYQGLARACLDDIAARLKLPILVGGTGLYIRSVIEPIDTAAIPQDRDLRMKLYAQSVSHLQTNLMALDQSKWGMMNASDRMNSRRLVRAVEVAMWNSKHQKSRDQAPRLDVLWIGLTASPELLRRNIESRVRARFDQGVVHEVKLLGNILNDAQFPAATSLGLSIVRSLIHGVIDQDEAVKLWIVREYQYAKRQLTWFRKVKDIHWFDISEENSYAAIVALVRAWYTT